VTHADAAFTAGRAALLGAALASGSEELFAAALADRLHEPYRSTLLTDVRRALPDGALGATLSGSGPTVIVWARGAAALDCARALEQHFGTEKVVSFAVSPLGAGPTNAA
jgi:homoserine kinase